MKRLFLLLCLFTLSGACRVGGIILSEDSADDSELVDTSYVGEPAIVGDVAFEGTGWWQVIDGGMTRAEATWCADRELDPDERMGVCATCVLMSPVERVGESPQLDAGFIRVMSQAWYCIGDDPSGGHGSGTSWYWQPAGSTPAHDYGQMITVNTDGNLLPNGTTWRLWPDPAESHDSVSGQRKLATPDGTVTLVPGCPLEDDQEDPSWWNDGEGCE